MKKGLYLQITPTNSKYWRFKFRFAGKEKKLVFGVYPDVSLADARNKRDEARKLLANDVDSGFYKKEKKRSLRLSAENSFESVALEWRIKFSSKWTQDHGDRICND